MKNMRVQAVSACKCLLTSRSACKSHVQNEDVEMARHIALQLKNDDGFYHECSIQSRELWEKLYSEEVFLEHMNKVFGSLL